MGAKGQKAKKYSAELKMRAVGEIIYSVNCEIFGCR